MRLIDAEILRDRLYRTYKLALLDGRNRYGTGIRDAIEIVEQQPTIEPELLKEQEAKTGHWISVDDGEVVAIDNDGCPERACYCSECQKYLDLSEEYAVHGIYCPVCGAKMEGR